MIDRRHLLASLALLPLRAHASWPDRPLRLIVPSAAGGSPDVICRILGGELGKALGQTIVIDNRPGASGNIGMQEIVRHLGGELFKSMTGSFIVHVPYRGSPQAIQDLIGGQTDLMFDNLSSIGTHIRQGRVRALAVSASRRSPAFPALPTVAEAGVPGHAMSAWGGIVAPVGTPAALADRLNSEINRIMNSPALAERWATLSFEPANEPAAQLFELARREQPMWADVIRRSGAKVE